MGFRLISLNVNGIRSAANKGLQDWTESAAADCMGVQELKAHHADIAGSLDSIAGMKGHFHCAEKKGYSGVGLYLRKKPREVITGIGNAEFDAEGRWVEARYDTAKRKLSLISCYFPSGSSSEERQQAKFRFLALIYPHLMRLKQDREFILVGDVNIAHREADLKNWKGNLGSAGFLPEERTYFDRWFDELGWVDVVRAAHPDQVGPYSWWSFRGKAFDNDAGWRIDYQIATPALAKKASGARVDRAPSYSERWSDHAPVVVDYDI